MKNFNSDLQHRVISINPCYYQAAQQKNNIHPLFIFTSVKPPFFQVFSCFLRDFQQKSNIHIKKKNEIMLTKTVFYLNKKITGKKSTCEICKKKSTTITSRATLLRPECFTLFHLRNRNQRTISSVTASATVNGSLKNTSRLSRYSTMKTGAELIFLFYQYTFST